MAIHNISASRRTGLLRFARNDICRIDQSFPKLSSDPLRIVFGAYAAAVALQRAVLADGVGPLEDPVLPRAQPAENLGFHGFRTGEAQIGLEPGK